MLTYQDFKEVGENIDNIMAFVYKAIYYHKSTENYKTAVLANEYTRRRNRTIVAYQRLLYTISGNAVPDNYSANYKICSNFFDHFITQETQFLLGNGVTWKEETTGEQLGEDFDTRLQEAAKYALEGGVSFGFFNLDKVQVFKLTEFVPLMDEEDGSMKAGIRFWQVDNDKPLRATLYEMDGYTDFIWNKRADDNSGKKAGEVLHEKRAYKVKIQYSEAEGEEIYDGENYPTFPIVPLWGNPHHQSEIVGLQEGIDAYDLIKSGFCNTVDEASMVYWTLQNAGGMDDIDLVQFVEHMKTIHASVTDGDAEAHTIEAPYASREAVLNRLRNDLYDDAMALDTKQITGGASTATQIKAAYEPLNNKTDQFEYCVIDFIQGILAVAGIEDNPTFTRSLIINTQEEISGVLQAAEYLDGEYVTRKLLTLLGDGDLADEVLERMDAEDMERLNEEAPEEDTEEGLEEEVPEEEFDEEIENEELEPLEDEEDDEIDRMLDELLEELERS